MSNENLPRISGPEMSDLTSTFRVMTEEAHDAIINKLSISQLTVLTVDSMYQHITALKIEY